MADIERMAQYSLKNADTIRRICAPLEQFRVKHFWCSRTSEDGQFLCIGSNPALHEDYYLSKSYLDNPSFRSPKLVVPGFYFHQNYEDDKYKKTIENYREKFDTEFCAIHLLKQGKELIRCGYASTPANASKFNTLFSNNIKLFEKFNRYFLREASNLFAKGINYSVNLVKEIGERFDQKSSLYFLSKEEKCSFLGRLEPELVNIKKLSPQEMCCMRFLTEGLSAPLIAARMGLSARTVEHYLDSAKDKLFCESKRELFRYATLLQTTCGFFGDE